MATDRITQQESWFFPVAPKTLCRICVDHIQPRVVAVCISDRIENHVNQYRSTLKILFGSRIEGFLRGSCRQSLECDKVPDLKSPTPCLWAQQSYRDHFLLLSVSLSCCLALSCNDNQQTSSWSVVADGWAHGRRLRWLDSKPSQPDFKGLGHGFFPLLRQGGYWVRMWMPL